MAIFHYTVKIVGRSKGKSVISASAYLNGDVMKNKETGRISYYTSKKEVVYAYADTYADIAKRVGISEKNVSVRLTLIRQKMKQYLIEREVFV